MGGSGGNINKGVHVYVYMYVETKQNKTVRLTKIVKHETQKLIC